MNKNNRELESKKFIDYIVNKIASQRETYLKGGYKVYSQSDEDGIIESIFSDIGIKIDDALFESISFRSIGSGYLIQKPKIKN